MAHGNRRGLPHRLQDVGHHRTCEPQQIGGREAEQKFIGPCPAIDLGELSHAAIDHHRDGLPMRHRRDSARRIPGDRQHDLR